MVPYSEFSANLGALRGRIRSACESCGRSPDSVALLPVTKTHPPEAVEYAARAGLGAVGENRVQEAMEKKGATEAAARVRWELIGHLQSNKAADAAHVFDRVQSVDSAKLLRRLDRFAGERGRELPVLLQCNTGEDPDKYGFAADGVEAALEAALAAGHLRVEGLMTIAPLDDDPDVARRAFDRLRELRDALAPGFGVTLPELSMGMTGDLEAAIAAGSTQIRVGTALFGERG